MAEGNSSGGLFSSGKVVAEAAVSVFQQKSAENVDKKEVAAAAADVLHAASTYGKLEDKPAGQYVEKAESYLKEFSAGGHAASAEQKPAAAAGDVDAAPPKPAEEAPKEPAVPAPAAEEGGGKSSSEGFGLDDVVKGAEQLVGKPGGGGGGEESAGGAAGGLFKMAQGFLK